MIFRKYFFKDKKRSNNGKINSSNRDQAPLRKQLNGKGKTPINLWFPWSTGSLFFLWWSQFCSLFFLKTNSKILRCFHLMKSSLIIKVWYKKSFFLVNGLHGNHSLAIPWERRIREVQGYASHGFSSVFSLDKTFI